VRLIQGRDGVFEVTVEGELLFSKRRLGRFPEPGEVTSAIRSR
jgi:selenoprotein W-related protein